MKFEVNNDLVWKRGNALANVWFFINHMVCSGYPHINVNCNNYYIKVTFFMEEEDNVEDIKEIASHYLSALWESEERIIRDDEGVARWILYKYRWNE